MLKTAFAKLTVAAALGLALTGCLSTPPSSLARLSRLSPLEADPAAIRFAVTHPQAFAVRTGDVSVTLAYKGDGAGPDITRTFKAEVLPAGPLPPELAPEAGSAATVTIVRLSDADAETMRGAQRRIAAHKAAGGDGKGNISVGATGCRKAPVPSGPLLMTTWISTVPAEPYFVLARDIDLRAAMTKAGADVSAMPPCGAMAPEATQPT